MPDKLKLCFDMNVQPLTPILPSIYYVHEYAKYGILSKESAYIPVHFLTILTTIECLFTPRTS